jgi:hypothetical protein
MMMLAQLSLDPALLLSGTIPNLLVVGLVVLGVMNILMGLILFRPLTAIHGVLVGAVAGVLMAQTWKADPSLVDFLVTGGAMGILGLILGWLLSREVFLLLAGWLATGAFAHLFGAHPVSWVFGVLLGTGVLVVGVLYMRWTAMIVTSTAGAAMLIFGLLCLITGARSFPDLIEKVFGPDGYYMLGYAGILVALVLAAVGVTIQNSLVDAVSDVFMPKMPKRKKRKKIKGTMRMTPPFAKF